MKRLVQSLIWFVGTIVFVIVCGLGYLFWQGRGFSNDRLALLRPDQTPDQNFILPAETEAQVEEMVSAGQDARPLLVTKFLERHSSPLTPHDHFGKFFVELADTYEFDFRLLPSIAMQESNLCKKIPEGSHNCLGLGIHERGTWGFDSFEANFEAAAKILKRDYIDRGLTTPEQIMRKYTPSSNGSWASSVNQWMAEMRYNDRVLGRALKEDANVLEFATPSANASPSASASESANFR